MLTTICREFAPPANLERIEIADPSPGPGEVLVQVRAAGVGFVDGLLVQGKYQVKPPLPYYPGSEFAGIVAGLGEGTNRFKIGDRVMGLAGSGAFSDRLSIRESALIALSDKLDDATAAGFFINYATALYGLRDCGKLQPDETVLILGAAGGVGSAAICVAKAMGARVIAAASSKAKRDAALSFGADQVVDYRADDWRTALKTICGDRGLQMVYDPVGGTASEAAFRSLSPGGRLLVVGFAAGAIPSIPLNLPLLKRSSIVGVDWGGEARAHPEINAELMATLMQWIDQGRLQCAPVTTMPMAEVAAALTRQLNGDIAGKLVLVNQ